MRQAQEIWSSHGQGVSSFRWIHKLVNLEISVLSGFETNEILRWSCDKELMQMSTKVGSYGLGMLKNSGEFLETSIV